MTGLDKIVENILAEAKTQADDILSAAEKQARELLDESATEAGAECAGIVDKAREEAELLGRISQSNSELAGRKMMLKTRREILDEVIAAAVASLKALPAEEYFDVLGGLAVKYAEKGDGEIVLSKKDRARVPADFVSGVNARLSGGSLSLADDTAETDGGFVLRYGGIEENCTFDALAEQERERISDELGAMLFGK